MSSDSGTGAQPLKEHQAAGPENMVEDSADSGRPVWDFPVEPSTAAEASTAPGRPTDEEILAQQNQIRADEARKIEYVGDLDPLSALKDEYAAGSDIFVKKISKLEETYSNIRRTRGDGNCFFRGLTFSYLESMLKNRDHAECDKLLHLIQEWKQKLIACNFQELVFEDAMDLLLEQVKSIANPKNPKSETDLVVDMRDEVVSNMIVMFLRMITSCEVQRREDFFFPFILGMYDEPPATVELFCRRMVEPMGEESDHIHIVAITDALQVPVRVVYLDRSAFGGADGGDTDPNSHDFIPDTCPPGTQPRVHLLYRPGHYDILYPRQ